MTPLSVPACFLYPLSTFLLANDRMFELKAVTAVVCTRTSTRPAVEKHDSIMHTVRSFEDGQQKQALHGKMTLKFLKINFLGRIFLGHQGPRRRDIPDPGPGMPQTKTLCKSRFSVVLAREWLGCPTIWVGTSRDLDAHLGHVEKKHYEKKNFGLIFHSLHGNLACGLQENQRDNKVTKQVQDVTRFGAMASKQCFRIAPFTSLRSKNVQKESSLTLPFFVMTFATKTSRNVARTF